jgi:SOS-response transcriptional repressor LexA
MRCSVLFDTLQKLINFRPSYEQLGKILGVRGSAIGNRVARDAEFSMEEISKIEKFYGIKILSINTNTDCVNVDFYPEINASCGFGLYASGTVEQVQIPRNSFMSFNPSKKYCIVNAEGNSMFPTIENGDKVIIEQAEFNTIEDDNVYLFAYNDKVYIKRLIMNINELVIKSDNADKETYRTQYISDDRIEEVRILGKVVGLFRNKV